MSGEGQQSESKADAGASKTYPSQVSAIRKNGYIVIKGRACKVVQIQTSKTGKHGHAKCDIVGIDIFNGESLRDFFSASLTCDVPYVNQTEYKLTNISEDGFLSLRGEDGAEKDDVKLPTKEDLLSKLKDGFAEGKHLLVTVVSAMGEEHITLVKEPVY